MAENKVEIQFKTLADLSAAQETADAIKKVAAEAKKQGQDVTQLNAAHKALTDKISASKEALKDETGVSKEAAEETEKLSEQKKTLLLNLKQLSREFPLLHGVISAIKNPVVAVTVVFSLLANAVRDYFAKVEEAVNQQNITESLRQQATAIAAIREELARASADFADKMSEAASKGKDAAAAFREYADQLQRMLDLEEKLTDATLAHEKAQIKLQQAQGKITSVKAQELTLAAEERAGARKAEAQKRAQQSKIDNLGFAIMKTEKEISDAAGEMPGEDEIAKARVDENLFGVKAADEGKTYDQRRKALTDKLSNLTAGEAARKKLGFTSLIGHGYLSEEEKNRVLGEGFTGLAADTERELEQLDKGHELAGLDAERAKVRRERIEDRDKQARARRLAGQERLSGLKGQFEAEIETQAREAPIKAQTQSIQQSTRQVEAQAAFEGEKRRVSERLESQVESHRRSVDQAAMRGGQIPTPSRELERLLQEGRAFGLHVDAFGNILNGITNSIERLEKDVQKLQSRRSLGPSDSD